MHHPQSEATDIINTNRKDRPTILITYYIEHVAIRLFDVSNALSFKTPSDYYHNRLLAVSYPTGPPPASFPRLFSLQRECYMNPMVERRGRANVYKMRQEQYAKKAGISIRNRSKTSVKMVNQWKHYDRWMLHPPSWSRWRIKIYPRSYTPYVIISPVRNWGRNRSPPPS